MASDYDPDWPVVRKLAWLKGREDALAISLKGDEVNRFAAVLGAERKRGREEGIKECEPLYPSQYDLGERDG